MDYVVFFKRHARMVIVIASVLVLGMVVSVTFYFTTEYGNVGPNEKIYYDTNRHHRPTLNPNPQYYLTIVVTGDNELLKNLQLYFLIHYEAVNIGCTEPVPGTFGTAGFNPYIDVMQWARKQQKSPYVFVFPLDRYQTGNCDWHIGELRSSNASHNWNESPRKKATSVFRFTDNNLVTLPQQGGGTLICDKQFNCEPSKDFTYLRGGYEIPLGNYTYFLHFIKQEEN